MPKNKVVHKSQTGAVTRSRPRQKLCIGTRKAGQSALRMTTEALKDVVNRPDMKRYRNKAIQALAKRGIVVDWPTKLVA